MNTRLKYLFDKLNEYWGKADKQEFQGEHPGGSVIQQEVLEELRLLSPVDAVKLINELTDTQINQIVAVLEEIISIHPQVVHSLRNINRERKIYWLNDELKLLGLIEKDNYRGGIG